MTPPTRCTLASKVSEVNIDEAAKTEFLARPSRLVAPHHNQRTAILPPTATTWELVKSGMLALSWGSSIISARFIISRGFPRLQILQAYERSGAESKKAEASSRTIDREQVRR